MTVFISFSKLYFSNFQSHRQDGPRSRKEGQENEQSSNIVEGLLEIVNMITDNPGLKSDLQEYFENSKREGKEVKRKITSEPVIFIFLD